MTTTLDPAQQLLFIDAAISDSDTLLAGIDPAVTIVRLTADSPALVQIAAAVSGQTVFSAIHIISHGSPGSLDFTAGSLTAATLSDPINADALETIRLSLSEEADILLYGCNVAEGESGVSFLAALADATGADVAASTDITGSALFGGDWQLEAQVGAVQAISIEAPDFIGELGTDSSLPSGLVSPTYTWNGYTFQTKYNGELTTSDPLNTMRSGCYWDRYTLSGIANGTTVRVYMGNSSTVDDFVQIERNGSVLTYDDDAGDGERSYDSFLSWTYQSGDIIRATTYSAGNTGSYSIYISTSSGTTTTVTDIGSAPPPTNYAPTFTSGTGNRGTVSDTSGNDSFSALTGTVTATDTADSTSDTVSYSVTNPNGTYGSLSINSSTGGWTFTPNNANIQALTGGSTTQSFTIRASDGANTADATISFTINGANDAVAASNDSAAATEASGINNGTVGTNPTGNVLSNDSDRDSGDSKTVSSTTGTIAGTYGTLNLASNGAYTYTVNNANATVNALTGGQSLTDSFTYTVTDGGGNTSSAILTVTINGVNDAPVTTADTGTAVEAGSSVTGSNATGNVLTNDADPEGSSLSVNAYTLTGTYGTLTMNADGSYSYAVNNTLAAVQALRTTADTLTDSFTYTVKDTSNLSNTATLTITLQGSSDNPNARDDESSAVEAGGIANGTAGSNATGNVLFNDTDVDSGDSKAVSAVRTGGIEGSGTAADAAISNVFTLIGSYGTLTLNTNGSYSYAIDNSNATVQALQAGQSLVESFNYTVSDTALGSDIGRLDITINGRNDAPVFTSAAPTATYTDTAYYDVFSDRTGTVTASDAETGTLTYDIRGGVTNDGTSTLVGQYGTLAVNTATGDWTFSRNMQTINALSSDTMETFSLRVTDAQGLSGLQTLTINITGVNDSPTSSALDNQTYTGGDWQYQLPAINFGDAEGQTLTYTAQLVDGSGNLVDLDDAGSNSAGTLPSWLSFDATTRTFIGRPPADSNEIIYLKVTVTDTGGLSDTRTFSLDLTNAVPTSSNDSFTMAEDGTRLLTLQDFGSFSDGDGDTLAAVKITTLESAGTLQYYDASVGVQAWTDVSTDQVISASDIASGYLRYSPAAAANGAAYATIGFKVGDGVAFSTDAYTLTVNVTAVNDAPTGTASAALPAGTEDTSYTVTVGDASTSDTLLYGFSDVDGDTLSITGLAADHGSVVNNGNGTYSITPDANYYGGLTLTYTVVDGHGGSFAATRTVTLAAVNDAPVLTGAQATLSGTTEDATTYTITAATLLQGFSDVDSTPSIKDNSVTADHGSFTHNSGTYTYVPQANYNGPVTLSYTVTDGTNDVASTQTFTLTPVNDAPSGTASATLVAGREDQSYLIGKNDLLQGFSDVDGDTLSITGLAATRADNGASAGTLTANADGSYTLTPVANYNGQVNLSYSVTDGSLSTSASRSFTLAAVNDAPTATNLTQTISYTEDAASVALGDIVVTDVDGDNVTATLVLNSPAAGVLTTGTYGAATSSYNSASGVWTVTGSATDVNSALAAVSFTPAANGDQQTTITTVIRDASGVGPAPGTITLDVTGVNDAPTTTNDSKVVAVNTTATLSLSDFGIYADQEGSALAAVKITVLPTVGSLKYDGSAVTQNQVVTVADISNGKLTFTAPTTGSLIAGYANIRFQVSDGTAFSTDSYILYIDGSDATVTTIAAPPAANNAPTATNLTQTLTYTEGDASVALTDIVVSDADASDTVTATLILNTPAAGVLTIGTYGGATSTYSSASGIWTVTGSVTDVNTALAAVSFTPAANWGQDTTITTIIRDTSGSGPAAGTITLDVSAVNQAPSSSDDSASTLENTPLILSLADFGNYSDPEDGAEHWVIITGLPTSGSLQYYDYGGNSWMSFALSTTPNISGPANDLGISGWWITVEDVLAGKLRFVPATGSTTDVTLSFRVQENPISTTNYDLTIDVIGVDDAPVLTGTKATLTAVNEDTAKTVTEAELLAGYVDPESGALSVVGLTANHGSVTVLNAGTDHVSFVITPDANYNGTMTLSYSVSDGVNTVAETQSYTVTAVNDAPALTGVQATLSSGSEDVAYTVTSANLLQGFTDVDSTISIKNNTVTADHGTVSYDSDTATYTITPTLNYSGAVTLSYTVTDGTADVATTQTFTLGAVNDTPTVANALADQNATEDTAFAFTIPANTFADIDSATLNYSVVQVDSEGAIIDEGDLPDWLLFNANTGTFSGTPANGDVGTVYLKVTASDGSLTATDIFSVAVANTNDAPVVSSPIGDCTYSGTGTISLSLSGVFTDVDAGDSMTYTVTQSDCSPLPSWLVFNSTDMTLAGNPPAGEPSVGIKFTAKDLSDASAYTTFTINLAQPTSQTSDSGVNSVGVATISGTATEGQELTAQVSDTEGTTGTKTYQWQSSTDGTTWTDIAGAQASTFTLTQAQVGSVVRVQVFYTDDGGHAEAPISAPTAAIANVNQPGTLTISGAMSEGEVLTTTLTDSDGLVGITPAYQWYASTDNSNWVAISDATNSYYTITSNEAGKYIRAIATYKDQWNTTTETATASTAGTVVVGAIAPVASNDSVSATEMGGTANGTGTSTVTGNLLTNDTDYNNDILRIDSVRLGSTEGLGVPATVENSNMVIVGQYGTLTVESDGDYSYQVNNSNATVQALTSTSTPLQDSFNYTVLDSTNLSDRGVLTVSINGANDAPVAVNITGSATEAGGIANATGGTDATGNVLTGASDVDTGAALTVTEVRTGGTEGAGTGGTIGLALTGTYGTLTLNSNGTYTYDINDSNATVQALQVDETLSETFNFTVSDGSLTDFGTLTVTINGSNDAPVASSFVFGAGTSIDVNEDDATTGIGTPPAAGAGIFEDGGAVTGTIGTSTDVDNATGATYVLDTPAAPGEFVFNADGTGTYNPGTLFQTLSVGSYQDISFTYHAVDATGLAGATETVTLRVWGSNDATTVRTNLLYQQANEDSAFTFQVDVDQTSPDRVFEDIDSDDVLTFRATLADVDENTQDFKPLPAWLSFSTSTAAFSGTPTNDVFSTDDGGTIDFAAQTKTYYIRVQATDGLSTPVYDFFQLTVHNTNDAAVITGTATGTVSEAGHTDAGAIVAGTSTISGDLNSTDVDSIIDLQTSATWSIVGATDGIATGTYGSIVIDPSTGVWSYTLNNADADTQALAEGQTGTDTFTARVTDNHGAITNQTVTVTVNGANDMPYAQTATNTATEDGATVTGNVTSTDVDTVIAVATGPTKLEAIGNTNGNDYYPQITAVGTDGAFVVTWFGHDSASDYSIFVHKFNADGSTNGSTVQLEAIGRTDGYDEHPQIAAIGTAGAFVVTWSGVDTTGYTSIFVQKFNADGSTNGSTVKLEAIGNTNGNDHDSQITAVGTDGAFVVTWYGPDSAGGDNSIFVQKFNADGTTAGNTPVQLEAINKTNGSDNDPQITAVGTAGAFVVTWSGPDSAGDYSIFVQKFNADGTTTNNTPVQLEAIGNTYAHDYAPQITAVGTAGAFVVTWWGADSGIPGDYSIFVQKFNADGSTNGSTVQLEAIGNTTAQDSCPQITAVGTAGAFVVTWSGEDSAGDYSIFVQKFNADGTTTNNTPVQLEPIGKTNGDDFFPQITAVGNEGAFVVTWWGTDSAGDNSIFVQKFNADGTTTNNTPVQLEAIGMTIGSDNDPQITAVGNEGEFVVTWYGTDSAGDNSIFVQKFNADGTVSTAAVAATYTLDTSVAGLTLNADGSYSFDTTNAAYQYLATGETLDVVANFTVTDDKGATDSSTLTVTVTGTNDAPVITVGEDDESSAAVTETNAVVTASGTLTVVDTDLSDTVTATVESVVASGTFAGTNPLSNEALKAMLTVTSSAINANAGDQHNLTWAFNSGAASAFDFLATGETLILTYTVKAEDSDSATANATQTVAVTITGTNDAPVISLETTTAVLDEDGETVLTPAIVDSASAAITETNAVVTASGTLTVVDTDLSDTVTATVESVVASGTFAGTNPLSNEALKAMLTVTSSAINANAGDQHNLTWAFNSGAASAFDFLATGETLVLTYTVQATDDDGTPLNDTQTVAVTITGTNDVPVVTNNGAALAGTVVEAGSLDDGTAVAGTVTATGTLSVSDVDTGATRTWSIEGTPSTTYGSIAIDASTGVWTYTLDNADTDTQALKEGQSVTQTYTARATDDFGAYVDQTITVTITGTNDVPVAGALVGATTLTEDVTNSTFTIATPFSDVDTNAVLSYSAALIDSNGSPTTLPSWLTFTPTYNTGSISDDSFTFTGTPRNSNVGTYTIRISATDDMGAVTTKDVTLTVANVNDAPVLTKTIPDQIVQENSLWTYTLPTGTFTDIDLPYGDSLSFTALNADGSALTWMHFNALAEAIAWTYTDIDGVEHSVEVPANAFYGYPYLDSSVGSNDIRVVVSDVAGASIFDIFKVTVVNNNDAPRPINAAEPMVRITGTVAEGQQLAADTSNLSDDDGVGTLHYQWQIGSGSTWTNIGTDASTLTITENLVTAVMQADLRIRVTVVYNDLRNMLVADSTTNESITSEAVGPVTLVNTAPTGTVTLTNTTSSERGTAIVQDVTTGAQQGDQLSVTNTLSDTDGVTASGSYQWYRDGVAVSGATGNTYTLTQADVGKGISVVASYTDDDGTSETVSSSTTNNIINVNDAPAVSAGVSSTADEGTDSYAVELLANASDLDNDTLSVTGVTCTVNGVTTGNGGADLPAGFSLNGTTLTVNPSNAAYVGLGDDESAVVVAAYTISDGHGGSVNQTATITINGVDAPPSLAAVTSGSVAEDTQLATTTDSGLSGTLTGTDTDSSGLTYGISGGTVSSGVSTLAGTYGTLTVNTSTGAYSFTKNSAAIEALDVEETANDSFTVTVTDSINSVSQIYTITINGADDAPSLAVVTSGSVAEDAQAATTTDSGLSGTLVGADVDVETLTYGISGGTVSSGVSTLAGTYGTLTVNTSSGAYSFTKNSAAIEALDATETGSDSFTVTVTDGDGALVTQTYTVNVSGADDAPTLGTVTAGSIAEDAQAATTTDSGLSGTLVGSDVDVETLTYGISGGTVSSGVSTLAGTYGTLTVNTSSGAYSFTKNSAAIEALDVEETANDSFTVTVTDGDGDLVTQTYAVTVTGANDTPVASADLATAREASGNNNSVAGITPSGNLLTNDTDVDGGDVKRVVIIDPVTGSGSTQSVPAGSTSNSGYLAIAGAYGTLRVGSDGSYTYLVDEANTAVQALRLQTDVLQDVFTYTMQDGLEAAASSTLTISIEGANDTPTLVRISNLSMTELTSATPNTTEAVTIGALSTDDPDDGETFTYDIIGGAQQFYFQIATVNGVAMLQIKQGVPLNAEFLDEYSVVVRSTDAAGLSTFETFVITIGDQNEFSVTAPTFNVVPMAEGLQPNTVPENSANGTFTGVTAMAHDADAATNAITYSLVANTAGDTYSAGEFVIDAASGKVSVNGAIDYEAGSSRTVYVKALSQDGSSSISSLQLLITNLNDNAPVFTSGATGTVAENAATSTVIYTAATTDADNLAARSYSLSGSDADLLNIESSTGAVTLKNSADFEAKTSYSFNVIANDGANSTTQAVVVSVTNLNDNAPVFTSGATGTVAENAATSTVIYTAATTDADNLAARSYSLSGSDADLLNIDSSTGAVTLKNSADFEAKTSYSFNVIANDGANSTTQAVVVSVTNLNDNVTTGTITLTGAAEVNETLAFVSTLSDADGPGSVSYQWLADNAAISGATGENLTINEVLIGKYISVQAAYTDGTGHGSSHQSSTKLVLPADFDADGDGANDSGQTDLTTIPVTSDNADTPVLVTLKETSTDASGTPVLTPSTLEAALPTVMDAPLGKLSISTGGEGPDSSNSYSLFVDSSQGINGFWAQNSNGVWVNLATKVETINGQTRVDFTLTDGSEFDLNEAAQAIETDGALASMPLSIVGSVPDIKLSGLWFG